jgi:hypothetical protein
MVTELKKQEEEPEGKVDVEEGSAEEKLVFHRQRADRYLALGSTRLAKHHTEMAQKFEGEIAARQDLTKGGPGSGPHPGGGRVESAADTTAKDKLRSGDTAGFHEIKAKEKEGEAKFHRSESARLRAQIERQGDTSTKQFAKTAEEHDKAAAQREKEVAAHRSIVDQARAKKSESSDLHEHDQMFAGHQPLPEASAQCGATHGDFPAAVPLAQTFHDLAPAVQASDHSSMFTGIRLAPETNVFKGLIMKGGPGSGNFGHEGRPGEQGGSGGGEGSSGDGDKKEGDTARGPALTEAGYKQRSVPARPDMAYYDKPGQMEYRGKTVSGMHQISVDKETGNWNHDFKIKTSNPDSTAVGSSTSYLRTVSVSSGKGGDKSLQWYLSTKKSESSDLYKDDFYLPPGVDVIPATADLASLIPEGKAETDMSEAALSTQGNSGKTGEVIVTTQELTDKNILDTAPAEEVFTSPEKPRLFKTKNDGVIQTYRIPTGFVVEYKDKLGARLEHHEFSTDRSARDTAIYLVAKK